MLTYQHWYSKLQKYIKIYNKENEKYIGYLKTRYKVDFSVLFFSRLSIFDIELLTKASVIHYIFHIIAVFGV